MTTELKDNTPILLDRVALNLLICARDVCSTRRKLAEEISERAIRKEVRSKKPRMDVSIKASQLKILFPDYLDHPSIWRRQLS